MYIKILAHSNFKLHGQDIVIFQSLWVRQKKAINLVLKNFNMLLRCDVKNTWNVLLIFHT